MRMNKRLFEILFFVLMSFSLIINFTSCGSSGGGGGGGSDGADSGGGSGGGGTGSITGAVSGTTVIAVNGSGDIVASDDTTGKTANALGEYPFTLTGIPVGGNVRVYLITGAGVFPMYFDSNGDGTPDTNVFSLAVSVNISLGFVSVHVAGQDGRAVPDTDPTDTFGVSGSSENTNVPDSITNPSPPGGASLSQLIDDGLKALNSGWVSKANNYFKSAVLMLNGSESQNDRDTVHFFYAATRIIALGFDITSDGNPNDMNRISDFMDRFGCNADDSRRANVRSVLCPDPGAFPGNSPTTTDLMNFGDSVIRAEIEGAIAGLNDVSLSFNRMWNFDNEGFESDYGDAILLRAALKAALAYMDINRVYHHDVDIGLELNDMANTIEKFLADNPSVLTLSDSSRLSTAKTWLTGALDDLASAINSIHAESDNQSDDLINLGDLSEAEIDHALADITDAKAALNGATVMADNDPVTGNEFTVNLKIFFEGLDMRSQLPPFDHDYAGYFPDITLGGIFPDAPLDVNINQDVFPIGGDGIPDIFQ